MVTRGTRRILLAALLLASLCTSLSAQPPAPAATSQAPSAALPDAPSARPGANAAAFAAKSKPGDLACCAQSQADKFKLAMQNIVSPAGLLVTAASSGYGQAVNNEPEFGQGAKGYGKRFGVHFADKVTYNLIGVYALPAMLQQSSAYVPLPELTFGGRVRHAIASALVTSKDGDCHHNVFNASAVGGNLIAASLGNAYYPTSERTASDTFERFGLGVAGDMGSNLWLEFWPTVRHKLFHKK
jgi:hypothetical protein